MSSLIWRATVITHRYLGVAVGLLMFVWFFSGIVMMYVDFPDLDRGERVRSLSPINWQTCCSLTAQPFADDQPVRSVEVQGVGGEPVMKLRPEGQPLRVTSLAPSGPSLELDMDRARAIAVEAAPRIIGQAATPVVAEEVDLDQWTVSGLYNPHRPSALSFRVRRSRRHPALRVERHGGDRAVDHAYRALLELARLDPALDLSDGAPPARPALG